MFHPRVAEFAKNSAFGNAVRILANSATLVGFFALVAIRTGRRNREHSAKGPALKAAANASRHEPAGFDFRPRGDCVGFAADGEMKAVRADEFIVYELLRHDAYS
jgi:hypothetical protein